MVAEKSGYGSLHVRAKTNTQVNFTVTWNHKALYDKYCPTTVVGKVKDAILVVTASLLTLFLFSYVEKNNKHLAKTDLF